jgi:hypothetical protein
MTAARDAGFAVERGEVVVVAANVLVRLEPGPIAARMSGATASFRDSAESLAREVQLAAALSAAGAPVVAPLGGPHEACGLTVTLWPWVDTVPSGDAATAGHALRACHDALLSADAAPLRPEPLGMLREARRLAATGPAEVALAVDNALETLRGAAYRIVHGDSHPGNVLWTADGALWSDWEDAHLPRSNGSSPASWHVRGCVATTSGGLRRLCAPTAGRTTRSRSRSASTRGSLRARRTWPSPGAAGQMRSRSASRGCVAVLGAAAGIRAALQALRDQGNEGKESVPGAWRMRFATGRASFGAHRRPGGRTALDSSRNREQSSTVRDRAVRRPRGRGRVRWRRRTLLPLIAVVARSDKLRTDGSPPADGGLRQRPLHLSRLVDLEHVALLDVLVVGQDDAALVAAGDLAHVVVEATQ